ncbi:hypothetical protein ElyMa_001942800 [Elysia marginata]|uniref:Uncharacterized protein n=1 Tax=Elysia marginata TaxID=1093978 RepID=A0AAV4EXT7_9GAST|nr:hypothetical protein ElyMa_001942800 [Elysia marginata]
MHSVSTTQILLAFLSVFVPEEARIASQANTANPILVVTMDHVCLFQLRVVTSVIVTPDTWETVARPLSPASTEGTCSILLQFLLAIALLGFLVYSVQLPHFLPPTLPSNATLPCASVSGCHSVVVTTRDPSGQCLPVSTTLSSVIVFDVSSTPDGNCSSEVMVLPDPTAPTEVCLKTG